MKNPRLWLVAIAALLIAGPAWAAAHPALSITGLVRQPLNLTLNDLKNLHGVQVQLNEVFKDGSYKGSFMYRGVPLRTLLELADIQKDQGHFKKRVDLAITVKNEDGQQIALSWGEVFYKNPGRIKEDVACNGSVVISTPRGLTENPALIKAIGQKGETLCIFMGLKDVDKLAPLLQQGYAPDTPACLIYKAGYSDSEALVRTTLKELVETAGQAQEKFLGLIYVGPCLKGKPAQ